MTTKVPHSMLDEKPCFRASHSVQQSIPALSWTKLQFDNALINVGDHYDTGTSRYTPPAGKHFLAATCELVATGLEAGSTLRLSIYRNGVQYLNGPTFRVAAATTNAGISVAGLVTGDGDDYFELFALYSVASGNATFTEVGQSMRFEGFAL